MAARRRQRFRAIALTLRARLRSQPLAFFVFKTVESNTLECDYEMPLQKKRPGIRCLASLGFRFLGCSAEPVCNFVDEEIDFSLGATAGIPVTLFEKHDQMIAFSLHAVQFI